MKIAPAVVVGLMLSVSTSVAQGPSFEVASVKPNLSGDSGTRFGLPGGGRFTATNATARELVRMAHSVQDYQLIGLPKWTASARYDIVARANQDIALTGDPARPTPVFQMLASLLAERFKLAAHRETREMPVLALVLSTSGTLGPRLTASTTDCAAVLKAAREKAAVGTPPRPAGDRVVCGGGVRPGTIVGGTQALSFLASSLSNVLGRMVIDRTGLSGLYDFTLEYRVDDPTAAAVNPDAPSLPRALQEELGITVESITAPVDVLVVDHIERPSQN
jgi:uncharacterized protein (TIGR03435 family)